MLDRSCAAPCLLGSVCGNACAGAKERTCMLRSLSEMLCLVLLPHRSLSVGDGWLVWVFIYIHIYIIIHRYIYYVYIHLYANYANSSLSLSMIWHSYSVVGAYVITT
jgi:hypothetical protein